MGQFSGSPKILDDRVGQAGWRKESWQGKAIHSQKALRAMMEERAKSGLISIDEPVLAEFHKGKEIFNGRLLISLFPDPIDFDPVVDFTGIGELKGERSLNQLLAVFRN
jgi:hypothetical protein